MALSRESEGDTRTPLAGSIGRAPSRSRRVKKALKLGKAEGGSAASARSTRYARA